MSTTLFWPQTKIHQNAPRDFVTTSPVSINREVRHVGHDWREWRLVTDMHFIHALVNQDVHPHMLQKHLYSSPLCVELCALVCVKKKSNGGATTRHTLVG